MISVSAKCKKPKARLYSKANIGFIANRADPYNVKASTLPLFMWSEGNQALQLWVLICHLEAG